MVTNQTTFLPAAIRSIINNGMMDRIRTGNFFKYRIWKSITQFLLPIFWKQMPYLGEGKGVSLAPGDRDKLIVVNPLTHRTNNCLPNRMGPSTETKGQGFRFPFVYTQVEERP